MSGWRVAWGIFRERAHSPGREFDDTEVLRLTAKELEAQGFEVRLKNPDEIGDPDERPGAMFLMCEGAEILRRLGSWVAGGIRMVNAPDAIFNTYRERMLTAWARVGVPFPASRAVPTDGAPPDPRDPGRGSVWVKRADVHNTREGDVVRADRAAAVGDALEGLARRGIPRAILQEHVEGDLVKFYGVGTAAHGPQDTQGSWFRHFYHRDQDVRGYPFDPRALANLAQRAADTLRVEVFGGDAIVTPGGAIMLIDLNAWPSFALYRDEAAVEIAAYLVDRFRRG